MNAPLPTEQQCGHTKLFADSFRGPEQITPCLFCERDRLRDALVKAVAVAQAWHNQGIPVRECSKLWDIYWRSSPEMKPIREALAALKETP